MHGLNKVVGAFHPKDVRATTAYNSVYPTLMQWLVKQHRDGHMLSIAETNERANRLLVEWFDRRRYALGQYERNDT